MEDVSKTVLRRLRGAAPAEGHPDPDLLTAFAEQSLAESERGEVLTHLAHCGDCREVVSLALPANEAVTLPNSVISRGGWLSLPVLRWGVVATGIILVTSVGVMQYERHQQSPSVVAKGIAPQLNAPLEGSFPLSQAASSPEVNTSEARTKKMDVQQKASAIAQRGSAVDRGSPSLTSTPQRMRHPSSADAISGYGSGSGSGIGISSGNANVPTKNPTTPSGKSDLPRSSEMIEMQSESAQATPAISDTTQARLAENSKRQQAQAREFTDLRAVGKAKNPVPAPAQSNSAPAPAFAPAAVPLQTSPALLQRALPRWTISPQGGLQRSFDAGRTWEDVNVVAAFAENRSVIGNRADGKAAAEYDSKKNTGKNADESLASSNLIFRAVAAMGAEVWAGGSNAILYHSVDSGADWIRVVPAEAGALLTGDITSIEFSDLQHCRISTSSGEVWLTANDGENWQKQKQH